MARNGIICSILIVYVMVFMPTTGQYCPKDSNPIVEDQTNCTFQIHNDTTAIQNLLKMVANWKYESIQAINIPIIISLNDTELTSHHRIRLHKWVMRNIDPDGPLYHISWRTDFNVLSFGLLNEVDSNPEFTLGIEETEGACTFQYGSESTTREIVRTVLNYIRESKLLDKTYEYENINMCFLSVFEWFKNSGWYDMKKYFGVQFQEFGYKCCKLYNQTVCCNDKLYNTNGYRLIPYIISVLLIGYVPLLLFKVANINHSFHPNEYYGSDKFSDNGRKLDPSFMSMFDNIFCINTMCNECNNKIIRCIINWFKSRIGRLLFVLLLPCGIYFEFILFSLAEDWKPKIEDIDRENVLFGFTPMLVNITTNTFLYPFGPLVLLIIYHLTGFIILVLPDNFEENVVKKGIAVVKKGIAVINITILEKPNRQGHKNLPGYIQLERVITTCMFMVFNRNFWVTCKDEVFCCNFWTTCIVVIRLISLPFLALPVFPFTFIILVGYGNFVMGKVCFPCICNNMENNGTEQPHPNVENNDDMGPEQMHMHETILTEPIEEAIGVKIDNIATEQIQTTNDTGAANNATCECTCKIIVYGLLIFFFLFFVYLLAVIVSYTVYIIVYAFYFMWWALVTSPAKTANLLMFVCGGIAFVLKIVTDGISFYKELFNLTIDVCQNEDCAQKDIYLQNGIIYINKDIVQTIQQAIYPFIIFIGYTIMKLFAVIAFYISYYFVIRTGNNDGFQNVATVITSALPTLVASQFKHKLPNKNTVTYIVLCYHHKNDDNVGKGTN